MNITEATLHAAPALIRSESGSHQAATRSSGVDSGNVNASAADPSAAGHSTDATVSAPRIDHITRVGGRSVGRASRETCSQSPTPAPSGSTMCAKRFTKKNALGTAPSPAKMRLNGSENTGRTSRSRAPSRARRSPKVSHAIT